MSGQWNQWNYTTGLAETPSANCIMNMGLHLTPIAVAGSFFSIYFNEFWIRDVLQLIQDDNQTL